MASVLGCGARTGLYEPADTPDATALDATECSTPEQIAGEYATQGSLTACRTMPEMVVCSIGETNGPWFYTVSPASGGELVVTRIDGRFSSGPDYPCVFDGRSVCGQLQLRLREPCGPSVARFSGFECTGYIRSDRLHLDCVEFSTDGVPGGFRATFWTRYEGGRR